MYLIGKKKFNKMSAAEQENYLTNLTDRMNASAELRALEASAKQVRSYRENIKQTEPITLTTARANELRNQVAECESALKIIIENLDAAA